MKSSVIIKGNKYGFQIVLNPTLSFEHLLREVATKFQESSAFFGQGAVAVSFEGRNLTKGEQNLLVDTIVENSKLRVSYIIDGGQAVETEFEKAISTAKEEKKAVEAAEIPEEVVEEEPFDSEQKTEKNGQFYRGTLRSGQHISVDGSIVILGDINPGAQVTAGGNVVVIGCLKGMVTAGYPNDTSAVVAALNMEPMQIKIGNIIARSPDQKVGKFRRKPKKNQPEFEAKLAFVENDNIFIETITRSLISEFSTNVTK
ncbi:MAG: septum site-determining protein MinC [Eubacteriales bacterium]|nr:septum site-determining protein MinC [Eubacteriales bacterium]